MLRCCTAASAPPDMLPVRIRMSPMWLTSNTPTAPRTALCSATSPPPDGYSTGISHPPKLTILAPNRRCSALRGVFRSSLILGEFAASIPHARAEPRAEIDTNMRSKTRQRSTSKSSWTVTFFAICPTWILRILPAAPGLPLCARASKLFSEANHARADRLQPVRQDRARLHLREVLHDLQRARQGAPLLRRAILLPRLPGGV